MMKLNMKVMAATLLAAASLGMAGNTYAAFNFGAFLPAVVAAVPGTNPGALVAVTAGTNAVTNQTTAAIAQDLNNAAIVLQTVAAGVVQNQGSTTPASPSVPK